MHAVTNLIQSPTLSQEGDVYGLRGEEAGSPWHTTNINEHGIQQADGIKFIVTETGSTYLLGGKTASKC